ncbi:hypothetical protein BD311DRAFT_840402 [Dichomitus squalens]|uniref:RanBD1 domain-containing protein n=1 Tax=Dichomitus squalens TaxID=114155 RepID=A0A4Q9N274_9APHY|nr:hypothetical protein BD311DRAFT_840402 [Dichomitus squalens]
MFPLNDFNFVACALATFSAAVGYNVSRRRGRNSNGHAESERAKKESRLGFLKFHRRNSTASARSVSVGPSLSGSDTGTEPSATVRPRGNPHDTGANAPRASVASADRRRWSTEKVADPEDGLLKRKRSPSPGLAQQNTDTPPTKRRRTPPAEREEREEDFIKTEKNTPQLCAPNCDETPLVQAEAKATAATAIATELEEPRSDEVPAVTEQVPTPCVELPPATSQTAPLGFPQSLSAAKAAVQPPNFSASWHANPSLVATKPSSAFSAFSGQRSAFANSFAGAQHTPVWSTDMSGSVSALSQTSPAFASSDPSDPLAASIHPVPSAQKVLTGEEDEEVQTEIKGAKVFIKRGDRDFCEGILGNVKILKHKETGHLRILFRREPIWKVTMSVRLRPTVRCTFDEAQGALRVTLKEPIEDTQQEHLVIYALKRGKASRSEFAEFAKAVADSAQLQVQTLV